MEWKKIEDICDINVSSINSSDIIDEIEYIDTVCRLWALETT